MITSIESKCVDRPPELELETPVAEVEPPETEIQSASLTSHLRLAPDSLRRAEEAGELVAALQSDISRDLQGLKLPITLNESLELQIQISREAPTDKRLKAIKAARCKILALHIHRLSQSPAPPAISHHDFRKSVSAPRPEALAHFMGVTNKTRGRRV